MLVIRTAEDMARALSSALDPSLLKRLRTYQAILAEYPDQPFEELGLFLVVQLGDRLEDVITAGGTDMLLPIEGSFQAEAIEKYGGWYEVTFILSDDGHGIITFVPDQPDTDAEILSACKTPGEPAWPQSSSSTD